MKKKINIVFVIVVFIYLLSGLIFTISSHKDVNYYENRTAYKISNLSIKTILNKTFQDNTELAFSDQTMFSEIIKKGYNFLSNSTTSSISNIILKNHCSNNYINLGNSIVTFDCDNNIVYYESYVDYSKEDYDNRISNINNTIEGTNIPVYIYYIEKDTDINFATNTKTDIYEYLYNNIKTNKLYRFEINNFDEFKNYFYKTDHHWNYKGSYEAYLQLVDILTEEDAIVPNSTICLNKNFSGSKASYSGASLLYKEEFCAYQFNYPDYEIKINGKEGNYGNHKYHISNPNENVTYGSFYGFDDGEIIFDTKNNDQENILIIGESYDNAILNLLAAHFNKTYSIDLRNYERENEKKFNYLEYIKENNIDKVLLIGNRDFFTMKEFNLEV